MARRRKGAKQRATRPLAGRPRDERRTGLGSRLRPYRGRILGGLLVVLVAGAVAGLAWLVVQRPDEKEGGGAIPASKAVEPFSLPDARTGKMFSLGDYLGTQDIVIVSYMGRF